MKKINVPTKTKALKGILFLISLIFISCAPYTKGPAIKQLTQEKRALLILDFQNDFFKSEAPMPVDSIQGKKAITTINKVLNQESDKYSTIVYVGNEFSKKDYIANWFRNNAAVKGTEGAQLIDELVKNKGPYFSKSSSDAFSNNELDQHLRDQEITELHIAGVFADQCVLSTVKGAVNRGYEVRVIENAIAAKDEERLKQAKIDLISEGAKLISK